MIEQDDCIAWMQRAFAPKSVDLIVTDPAYESLEKHRATGTTTRLTAEWFEIFRNHRWPEFFLECWRVLKSNAHLYVLCDQETMFVVRPIAERYGFRFWKPIVWDKQKIGMGYHYRCRYEFALFFEKGERKLNDLSVPDVLSFPSIRNGYPTEKPVDLLRTLIRQSTAPGELVIDPFCGSGSTGEAAMLEGRRFKGCDLSEHAVSIARARLEEVESRGDPKCKVS